LTNTEIRWFIELDEQQQIDRLLVAFEAALIGMAVPALVRNGDRIAELTGLSRSWIGLILLATATSLPELFTRVSASNPCCPSALAMWPLAGCCWF